MLMENFSPWGVVYPCPGAIYMYISIIMQPFFSPETAWPIEAKLHMKHLWEGGKKVYINVHGHMTKMAAMAINRKKKRLKIFFSRTRRPMILKLGVKHQAMELYKVYINHDHGMTLTFFTARST